MSQYNATFPLVADSSGLPNIPIDLSYGTQIALGTGSIATGNTTVAIGADAVVSGNSSIAIGQSSSATGSTSIAVGPNALAVSVNNVVVGRNAFIDGPNATGSIAIGSGSSQALAAQVSAGVSGGIAIGPVSDVVTDYGIAIGNGAFANGVGSIAIGGANAAVTGDGARVGVVGGAGAAGAIAIGTGYVNTVASTFGAGNAAGQFCLFSAKGTATVTAGTATVNATSGRITLAAALGITTGVSFTFSNTFLTATSVLIMTVQGQSSQVDTARPAITVDFEDPIGAGTCTVHVFNGSNAATSTAPVIHFLIM